MHFLPWTLNFFFFVVIINKFCEFFLADCGCLLILVYNLQGDCYLCEMMPFRKLFRL